MTEEIHDYTAAGEELSEKNQKESAKVTPNDPLTDLKKNVKPVSEVKDGEKAVDPDTGHADEESVPPAPQPAPGPAPQPADRKSVV